MAKPVRQRRSVAERTELVERWKQSGLTAREFADQAGLTLSSLYLWNKQCQASTSSKHVSQSAFTELRLANVAASPVVIEVVARNGRIVRVPFDISVQTLRRVLEVVEQC